MLVTIYKVKDIVWYETFHKGLQHMNDMEPNKGKQFSEKFSAFISNTFIGAEFVVDTEEEAYDKLEEFFSFVAEQLSNKQIKELWKEVKEVIWDKQEYETDMAEEGGIKESRGIYKPSNKEKEDMKTYMELLKEIKEEEGK